MFSRNPGTFPNSPAPTELSKRGVAPIGAATSAVAVAFSVPFASDDWRFESLRVINTVDGSPLNLWPALIPTKNAAGFTVWLNGDTDSPNYQLEYSCAI